MNRTMMGDVGSFATDEQLLGQHARGVRGALDELFQRHLSAVYRVAYRRLGREADALDAVQEGFVKALRHLGSFRGRSSFKTWLLRIVENSARDLRRRLYRQRALRLDTRWLGDPATEPSVRYRDPLESLQRAELRPLFEGALATLSWAQRQAFILFADTELSYREIAVALGVPIGTVMSRIYYARRKLQACLAARKWVR